MFAPVLSGGRGGDGNPGNGSQDDYHVKNADECLGAHAQNMNNG
jgi:hypothetical protein